MPSLVSSGCSAGPHLSLFLPGGTTAGLLAARPGIRACGACPVRQAGCSETRQPQKARAPRAAWAALGGALLDLDGWASPTSRDVRVGGSVTESLEWSVGPGTPSGQKDSIFLKNHSSPALRTERMVQNGKAGRWGRSSWLSGGRKGHTPGVGLNQPESEAPQLINKSRNALRCKKGSWPLDRAAK